MKKLSFKDQIITFSIVSHSQGILIQKLLLDFFCIKNIPYEIILTLNVLEDEAFLKEFENLPIRLVRNQTPKGFGANHNAAFKLSTAPYFAVVNPDIRLNKLNLQSLLDVFDCQDSGVVAPSVVSGKGTIEDSARKFPTLKRLSQRVLFKRKESDYLFHKEPILVDWVAGMFVIFRQEAFDQVGGFDERFFMYMEDADICRRLQQHGWSVLLNPACSVIHDAQRASHRNIKHLRWHLTSAFRYFTGL